MIQVYNTLTRTKENFKPIEGKTVRMYVCGPTVYDYPHIGNARSFVVFDTIRRYFEYRGYHVRYVTNFTDVDDKMIARANREGTTIAELARQFISEYLRIAEQLNLKAATANPRATEHIEEMVQMVQKIIDSGRAYVVEGDVYFDVSAFPGYGKFSQVSLEELTDGARKEAVDNKNDPKDFALWKAQKPGEPAWDSPWGRGRPGWHLECSVMGAHYLGIPFDIHGGGQDLIFPHHENEIAQSMAAYGVRKPVKYWLHNGFLTINAEKMSKSEGNFFTAREVLDNYDPQAVRLFLISAHYRQPLDYNQDALRQASQSMERIWNAADTLKGRLTILERGAVNPSGADDELVSAVKKARDAFEEEMDDDFNTPAALSELFNLVRAINTHASNAAKPAVVRETLSSFSELMSVIGIDLSRPRTARHVEEKESETLKGAIELLLELRENARKSKDFATADMIRKRLADLGVIIADTKDGPTWKLG